MLSTIDELVLRNAGQLAGRYPLFDEAAIHLALLPSVKLLPLFALLVYLWFQADLKIKMRRACIEAICAGFLSLVVSRMIQNLSPERPRPLHSGNPVYVPPIGIDLNTLNDWSSFPSDHASMVFGISTAVFLRSRHLGVLCYFWATVVVCLPRIYGGYHYFSDVLGGTAVGALAAIAIRVLMPAEKINARMEHFENKHRGLFCMLSFVLIFQFVTMFNDIRDVARVLIHHL